MTPSDRVRRSAARAAAAAFALTAVAFALTAVAGTAPAWADSASPTPSASSAALPGVPSAVPQGQGCLAAVTAKASAAPWTQQILGLDAVWQLTEGQGVTVAVVDTGVAAGTPGLAGRVRAVGAAGTDCVGHGSFVAGIIAAAPLPGVGFTGVAPGARVLAVRGTDARGNASAASVAAGLRAAVDGGAKVVDVSLALKSGNSALAAAVIYARAHDVLVVAPAAPDTLSDPGTDQQTPAKDYWPAAYPGVLSVLDFGSTGGRPQDAPVPRSAGIAGPGDQVVGPAPHGGGDLAGSGSSAAAGFVAGAAALVRSYRPGLTADQVRQQLVATAYPAAVPRVDPYAAVTGQQRTTERSALSTPAAVVLPTPLSDDGSMARTRALVGAVAVALLLLAAAVAARRWRSISPAAHDAPAGRRSEAAPGVGDRAGEDAGPGSDPQSTAEPLSFARNDSDDA